MRYTFLARTGTGTTGTAKYRVAWAGVDRGYHRDRRNRLWVADSRELSGAGFCKDV